ncbi:MAG: RES family NAD+ phosphorylase [Rhodospirillales bacterium]|nr:RES family NAD+ phosphorylase [Rhodospirillales bacterium]
MLVWRLARLIHAGMDGEGARIYGGRWNSSGRPMIYTASSPSLALLEVRVHLDLPLDMLPRDYHLISIDLGDLEIEAATADAMDDPVSYGDRWLAESRSPALKVPSFIVPEDGNVLVNPLHPDARGIKVISQRPFSFDPRLF